jgi:two-component system torCAD operon response regulator TorR
MVANDPPTPLPNPRVLLIEDNSAVAETLQKFIERSGMRTAWAQTGAKAMELKRTFMPDVVLVDLELPDTNGVNLIGWLASTQDCGIIVVSGRSDESERIVGLELGADDYISKPPQLRELVARIRAVHRRSHHRAAARGDIRVAAATPVTHPVQVGPWRIDLQRRAVMDLDSRPLPVTAAEFAALQELVLSGGQAVSRERLSETALRRPWRPEDRSIDQLIFSLRRKLGDGDGGTRMIQSVRGAGYILAANQTVEAQ